MGWKEFIRCSRRRDGRCKVIKVNTILGETRVYGRVHQEMRMETKAGVKIIKDFTKECVICPVESMVRFAFELNSFG